MRYFIYQLSRLHLFTNMHPPLSLSVFCCNGGVPFVLLECWRILKCLQLGYLSVLGWVHFQSTWYSKTRPLPAPWPTVSLWTSTRNTRSLRVLAGYKSCGTINLLITSGQIMEEVLRSIEWAESALSPAVVYIYYISVFCSLCNPCAVCGLQVPLVHVHGGVCKAVGIPCCLISGFPPAALHLVV